MNLVFCFVLPSPSSIAVTHPSFPRPQTMFQQRYTKPSAVTNSIASISHMNRRSANYHPTIWDHQFLQSLKSPYQYGCFKTFLEELKQKCKLLLKSTREQYTQLEIIDSIQWLGVAHHFEEEIKDALDHISFQDCDDLRTTALQFQLLRQNGYFVNSDVFNKFTNRDGRMMEHLSQDIEGLLSLYEASNLSFQGEDILEEAWKFTSESLIKSLTVDLDIFQAKQVRDSLEIPRHFRMLRFESRNFIDVYEKERNKCLDLLELAKLDYNLVQSIHQRDIIELSRWWSDLGFVEKLPFSRDRLVENFFWSVGIIFELQFSKCRQILTKFICILTAIDDMYDVHGYLDELELFTTAVDRWDINGMNILPDYMKICYLAMYNFANEIVYSIHKDHGFDASPYIKKAWADLCKSYLVEARWFSKGYTPTLEEYLGNACTSVGGPAALVHAYLFSGETIKHETLDCLNHNSELVHWSSLIVRLADDLGTSKAEMDRGDVPKSIKCYMVEKGVLEDEAREYIKGLVRNAWKKLNEERIKSSLPKSSVNMAMNMARTGQCIFEHGDGIGTSDGVMKSRVISLLMEPV